MSNATVSFGASSYINANSDGQYSAVILNDGPLRYYKLDERTGNNVAADSSGNGGLSGTWGSSVIHANSIMPTEYVGGSAQFPSSAQNSDDPNAVVSFPYEASAIPSGSFSFEFSVIFANGAGGVGTGRCMIVQLQDTTGIRIYNPNNDGRLSIDVNGVRVISSATWLAQNINPHYGIVTYDATTKLLSFYSSGVLMASTTLSSGPTFTENTGLRIGKDSSPSPSYPGNIDSVVLYPYALTQAQVTNHAKAAGITNPNSGGSVKRLLSSLSNVNTVGDGLYMKALLADSALRIYKLNDPDSVARDFSGNGGAPGVYGSSVAHDYSGAASDYVSTAARFPSAGATTSDPNAVITFPRETALQFNGTSFSVEFIHNLGGNNNNTSFFNLGDNTGLQVGYVPNNGAPRVSFGGTLYLSNSPTGVLNEPIHMAFVYDATAQTLTFYNNGVNRGAATVSPANFSSTMGLILGQRETSGATSVDGSMQYVSIFNYALTPTQVAKHATAAGAGNGIFTGVGFGGSVPRLLNARANVVNNGTLTTVSIGSAANIGTRTNAILGAASAISNPASQTATAASQIRKVLQIANNAAAQVMAPGSSSIMAVSWVVQIRAASLSAGAHVLGGNSASLGATASVRQKTEKQIGAGAQISVKQKGSLTASALLVEASHTNIRAGAYVRGNRTASIGAAADVLARPVGRVLGAAATVLARTPLPLPAHAVVQATRILTMQAETRIAQQQDGSLQASSWVSGIVDAALQADALIQAPASQAIQASSQIIVTTDDVIEAAAMIAVQESATLGGGCYVIVPSDVQIGAAALVVERAQTRISAHAFIAGYGLANIGAGAQVVRIQHTERLLEALSRVAATIEQTLNAGAAVAFIAEKMNLAAGAFILEPFTPTLHAQAYIVDVGSLPIAAGARVGRVAVTWRRREPTYTPYYGQRYDTD